MERLNVMEGIVSSTLQAAAAEVRYFCDVIGLKWAKVGAFKRAEERIDGRNKRINVVEKEGMAESVSIPMTMLPIYGNWRDADRLRPNRTPDKLRGSKPVVKPFHVLYLQLLYSTFLMFCISIFIIMIESYYYYADCYV